MSFKEKVALVTGGARGIGAACVRQLQERGASVVVADVDGDAAVNLVNELGGNAEAVVCDVSDPTAVQAAVAAATEAFGGLDVLVNNAGIEQSAPIIDISDADFRRVVDVNLLGVFHGTKYAARAMASSGGGVIVNVSSVAAFGGVPLNAAYCAAKSGVVNFTRAAALELRDAGIRVNCVCPGIVQTPMMESGRENLEALLGMSLDDFVALRQGRWGTPDDIAGAVLHLASDEASFASGTVYRMDHGLSAGAF